MAARKGNGNPNARIMLIGEAWGAEEERLQQPFMGASGSELNRMLQAAGVMRSEVWVTNLVNARPRGNDFGEWVALKKKDVTPEHTPFRDKMVRPIVKLGFKSLVEEIELVKPNVIIPLGNYSMWALTGAWGILKWRGSMLNIDIDELKRLAQ